MALDKLHRLSVLFPSFTRGLAVLGAVWENHRSTWGQGVSSCAHITCWVLRAQRWAEAGPWVTSLHTGAKSPSWSGWGVGF